MNTRLETEFTLQVIEEKRGKKRGYGEQKVRGPKRVPVLLSSVSQTLLM